MALTDRLGGKVRSAVRRVRRDGPLDIVFVLFNADGMGGTARSGIEQANALLSLGEGHRVRILSVTRSGASTHYRLADGLEVTYLVDVRDERPAAVRGGHAPELAERESLIVPRSWDALYNGLTDATMREALGAIEADVLVTTTPELLAVVAQLAPADVALVHQEHRASSSRVNDLGALLQFAPRADVVVSLTESMSRWLAGRLGGAAPELQVIPNPLPAHAQERSPLDQRAFVTAGRLAPEKQFEHVVDAFWRIHEQVPGWTLTVWGDGPRADNLAAQVRKLGLEDRVRLPGSTDDLAAEWARASVAVLASRGEGYPLVLQEAMSAGVPPVSYDCPSGPREIITHDVDGLLVPPGSKAALAAAMLRIATDDDLRARLGAAALDRSERWDGQLLARQWVDTFRTAIARRADPLAPRRVLHGLRPGPLGDLPETDGARGVTPAQARTASLTALTTAAAATGEGWFVVPARGLDPHPLVVVPSSRRGDFLAALASGAVPDWLSVRDPAERGWPERRGTVAVMTGELARTRTASLFLEPWPMRGGHDGVLGEGVEVGVQFWEESPDGDLLAPGPNRWGDRVPVGTPRTTTTVEGVEVPTLELMALPTIDDCRFDVDVVYTWVDGDDEAWLAARDERITGLGGTPSARASGASRYRSRDELRYSMRSIHLFAPWVRRIHLVTAGQVPDWLDTSHDRVRVVDHREILPGSALPTFSSHAIETRLHAVPDLADHFVYVNDDVFLGRPRRKEHFFAPGGQYAAFVADHRAVGLPGTDDRPYLSAAQNNRRLLADAFGVTLTHTMMHSPHPQRRTTLEEISARFPDEVSRTTHAPFRSETDLSMLSSFAQSYGLVTGQAFRARAHHGYVDLGHQQLPVQLRQMLKRDRDFFCIADNLLAAFDEERADGLLHDFLEQYFPIAAPWELAPGGA
ncbi:stealth conserved region 3 domain-containing protein [Nocardioides ganghwensis]|uniref:stealth conserved region 3 domain-containing protein n=1 Tax=Nocardioides ganghwensis TaxID=252230 RepID=UPI0013EBA5E4|nr:stealth conserved region 3 domain-containing protein [Nocardioides ganghwensis]MBD3944155.1 stealth conserved region 3 domain-containing protein [Nocardioides ganghwensis]